MKIRNDLNESTTNPHLTLCAEITPGIIIDIDKNIYSDINALLKLRRFHSKLTKKKYFKYRPKFQPEINHMKLPG